MKGFYFNLGTRLFASTTYTVTLSTDAKDMNGGQLTEPYVFSFTTEPVKVTSVSPANGATYVSTWASIYIRFNTNMDQNSVEEAFSISPSVSGFFRWSNYEEVSFNPDSSLASLTIYSVTVDTTARDLGQTLGQ